MIGEGDMGWGGGWVMGRVNGRLRGGARAFTLLGKKNNATNVSEKKDRRSTLSGIRQQVHPLAAIMEFC